MTCLITSLILAPCFNSNSFLYKLTAEIKDSFFLTSLESLFLSDCFRVNPCNCFSIIFSSRSPNTFRASSLCFFKNSSKAILIYRYNLYKGYCNHNLGYNYQKANPHKTSDKSMKYTKEKS